MAVVHTVLTFLKGQEVASMVSDGTYLFIGMADGTIWRYTLAGGAINQTWYYVDGRITNMEHNSGTLYVSVEGGLLYSITTS